MKRARFGKVLQFNFEGLRAMLRDKQEREALRKTTLEEELVNQIPRKVLKNLEAGRWDQLKYHHLHSLICQADICGFRPLLGLVDSPIWATFRQRDAKMNYTLVGTDLDGHHLGVDSKCVNTLTAAFPGVRNETVTRDDDARIRDLLVTKNVVAVGGAKVNYATEVALETLIQLGAPSIKFRWPGYSDERAVIGASDNRSVEIAGEAFVERRGERDRLLGVVAFCRRPGDVTTVVISGCSKEAAEEMLKDLDAPYFYRDIDMGWTAVDKPIVMLFDTDAKARWRAIGVDRPKGKPGRPPGARSSGPRTTRRR